MTNHLALSDIKIFPVNDDLSRPSVLSNIENYFKSITNAVESVYIISSIEGFCFTDPALAKLIKLLHEQFAEVPWLLSSIGCVSFYATLLSFMKSHYQKAILFFIEGPHHTIQNIIDSLGIGIRVVDGGLRSQESYALCIIEKDPIFCDASQLWIDELEIISRNNARDSLLEAVAALSHFIMRHHHYNSKFVSFNNHTAWCQNIFKLFNLQAKTNSCLNYQCWLESVEESKVHYHSLKPLHEIQRYQNILRNSSLIVATAGANGRLALLHISREKMPFGNSESLHKIVLNSAKPSYQNNFEFLLAQSKSVTINQHNIGELLYCLKKEYTFIKNLVFEWPLFETV